MFKKMKSKKEQTGARFFFGIGDWDLLGIWILGFGISLE
jgi:hypothetical protein